MNSQFIFETVQQLTGKYQTRDPLKLLECLNVDVGETDSFQNLKGYCFYNCKTFYVRISSFLPEAEKRIVAAHELGHVQLHRQALQMAPMKDSVLYDMTCRTEYEANLFAADLMIEDRDVEELSRNQDLDYFGMCSSLYVSPDLMSFKLYSLIRRGSSYQMPLPIDSTFLGKNKTYD